MQRNSFIIRINLTTTKIRTKTGKNRVVKRNVQEETVSALKRHKIYSLINFCVNLRLFQCQRELSLLQKRDKSLKRTKPSKKNSKSKRNYENS